MVRLGDGELKVFNHTVDYPVFGVGGGSGWEVLIRILKLGFAQAKLQTNLWFCQARGVSMLACSHVVSRVDRSI